ncbi:NAD dependent epimerase/dehydratase [Cordyceps javanica]|uniref:NAD dependent epimerase/dehydratase n=1 Tax=Cordyceps javanica TaxID=43265 RepID=A0A545VQC8_9HYPO|nr:NAD dependent epimerase/dehydratase [Cordyceps javanica]TQW03865.1 NAD dependent epimerase/dehydratase [Cordyceps javanica]
MLPEHYPIDGSEGYPRATPMKVIFCAFPRTGTMSTQVALQMLGFNRTHHMTDVIGDGDGREAREWTRAIRAKYRGEGKPLSRRDWDRLLGDCQACVDFPSALFAADLARLYPEAKVVMVNRDPDKWYESLRSTVAASPAAMTWAGVAREAARAYSWLLCRRTREMARFWLAILFAAGTHEHFRDRDAAVAFMRSSYDECRAAVAEDRRIEWSVQDGWEPLCRHLGVDVPRVRDPVTGDMVPAPFPRVNDRAQFGQHSARDTGLMVADANQVLFGLIGRGVALAALGYGAHVVWKAVSAGRV